MQNVGACNHNHSDNVYRVVQIGRKEVESVECTALVVRDQYWEQYKINWLAIRGIKMPAGVTTEDLERVWDMVAGAIQRAVEAIKKVVDALVEEFVPVVQCAADIVGRLRQLFDDANVSSNDLPDIIVDKFHNHFNYLENKRWIKERQYYDRQFQLVRMHVCIQNHIKK